jgi:antiviral helicase SLH1
VGYICTTADKLQHYVASLTEQHAIESQMEKRLIDNFNAEISLGTVTTIDEAVQWLGYTYLYIRMRREPHIYGIDRKSLADDPFLGQKRRDLVTVAAKKLHDLQMIVFDPRTGNLMSKDLGRIASNFYIYHTSVEIINRLMTPSMEIKQVLHMLSECSEFSNIKSRGSLPSTFLFSRIRKRSPDIERVQ